MNKYTANTNGLKFELKHGNELDDKDWIPCEYDYLHQKIIHEFSDNDKSILLECINKLKNCNTFNNVLEIGVNRSREYSSTQFLFSQKPRETKYIGVDLNCSLITEIFNVNENRYGICCNSGDYATITNYMASLNVETIDLLIIDGWHSINQLYLDFKLSDKLSKNGIVFFHDTNYHPGPKVLLECIDENVFIKHKFFEGQEDWGVAYLQKI